MQSVLNVHLPAASSPAETHARIHVYYVSVDKKSGKTFLSKVNIFFPKMIFFTSFSISQAKENKVELLLDVGGWVDINLLHLTR